MNNEMTETLKNIFCAIIFQFNYFSITAMEREKDDDHKDKLKTLHIDIDISITLTHNMAIQ